MTSIASTSPENTLTTRPAVHQWDKSSGKKRPFKFVPGDVVVYTEPASQFHSRPATVRVGEVVEKFNGLEIGVHRLQRQMVNSKLWHYPENAEVHYITPESVNRHVSHDPTLGALTKERVREAYRLAGFAVGCELYCLIQHENEVDLDMAPGDSDDEEEDDEEIADEMKDFIVPDNEGEAFCHPKPEHLTEEQRAWVNTTHAAVREWDTWVPKDQSEQAIKDFVDNMTAKYGHEEDNRQFTSGSSVDMYKPPSI